ncbi:MAG: c-type cytochrome [Planctomycetes bacterium]|nr:c-type cytochrome [Planctomycetota bacterium]
MLMHLYHGIVIGLTLLVGTPSLRAQVPSTPSSPAETAASPPLSSPAPIDTAGRLFVSRCTGCHTIGRGVLTGPDLSASIAWRESDLETAILRMQEKAGALRKDEIADLIRFIKDPAVKIRIAAEEARIVQLFAATLAPPDAETGRRLFSGEQLLANGGMACLACHRIGDVDGGTLGLDLTGVFGRMGEMGLVSALEKAPFQVMAPVYRDKPLTRQEAVHLTRWIQEMESKPAAARPDPVLPAALSVAALCLVAIVLGTRSSQRVSAREWLATRRQS